MLNKQHALHCLTVLKQNDLGLFPTDKGLGLTVFKVSEFNRLTRVHIDNSNAFETLHLAQSLTPLATHVTYITREAKKSVSSLLERCQSLGFLDQRSKDRFLKDFPSGLPWFEILLKIHKPTVESRPIMRGFNAPCTSLFQVLNVKLGEIWCAYKLRFPDRVIAVRDSLEVIQRLSLLRKQLGSFQSESSCRKYWLITLDIKALYPSMRWEVILQALRCIARLAGLDSTSILLICEIEKYILQNNYMLVNSGEDFRIIRQLSGSITGSNHAVKEADIYLGFYEHLNHFPHTSILTRYRYVDDILAIVYGTEVQMREAVAWLMSVYGPELSLTHSFSETSQPFLDISVHLDRSLDSQSLIKTEPLRKPLKDRLLLHWKSNHPRSVFKGVIIGETIRRLRLSSSRSVFRESLSLFHRMLFRSGWDRRFVLTTKCPSWKDRTQYLSRKIPEPRDKVKVVYLPLTFSDHYALEQNTRKLSVLLSTFTPEQFKVSVACKVTRRLSALFVSRPKKKQRR
jgi:hypothetical protein